MLPSILRGRPRRNHGPPPVPPIPNNGSEIVWTPGQDTTAYESAVVELLNNERPESTRRALDPKIDQYYSYCDQAYPDDRYKYILNEKYVFRFMFYQVMRSQRKRGGRRSTRPPAGYFDYADYQSVMDKYSNWTTSPNVTTPPVHSRALILPHRFCFKNIKYRSDRCFSFRDSSLGCFGSGTSMVFNCSISFCTASSPFFPNISNPFFSGYWL